MGGGRRCRRRCFVRWNADRTVGRQSGGPVRRGLRAARVRRFRGGLQRPGCVVGRRAAAKRVDLPDDRVVPAGPIGEALWIFYESGAASVTIPVARRCQLSAVPHRRRPRDRAFPRWVFGPLTGSIRIRRVHRRGCALRDLVGACAQRCLRRRPHEPFRVGTFTGLPGRRHRDPDRGTPGARQSPHRPAHDAGDAHRRRRVDGVVGQRIRLSHRPRSCTSAATSSTSAGRWRF